MKIEGRSGERAWVWLLGGSLFAVASGLLSATAESPNRELWGALGVQGLWVGVAVGVARGLGGARDRLGLGPGRLPVGAILVLAAGFMALSHALNALLVWLEARNTGALAEIDRTLVAAQHRGAPSLLLAIVTLGIAPGIAEELLFRGLLQRELARRVGLPAAIGAASVLFALAHFDRVHSPVALILGAYLGVVAALAGSVRPAVLCHVLNNTLALVGAAAGLRLALGGWLVGGLGLGLAGGVLVWAARRGRSLAQAPGERVLDAGDDPI